MSELDEMVVSRSQAIDDKLVLLKQRRYAYVFISRIQGKKTIITSSSLEEMMDKIKGVENKMNTPIDYKNYEMPIEKKDYGLKPKPLLVRIFNFLSKRAMPYSKEFEYFREVAIHKNPKQLEYRNSVVYYPELKQFMTILMDKNTGQLIGYRVNDEKKYNETRHRLIQGL